MSCSGAFSCITGLHHYITWWWKLYISLGQEWLVDIALLTVCPTWRSKWWWRPCDAAGSSAKRATLLSALTYRSNQWCHHQKCVAATGNYDIHSCTAWSGFALQHHVLLLTGVFIKQRGRILRNNAVIVNLKWVRQGEPVLRLQHKNQVMNKSQEARCSVGLFKSAIDSFFRSKNLLFPFKLPQITGSVVINCLHHSPLLHLSTSFVHQLIIQQ